MVGFNWSVTSFIRRMSSVTPDSVTRQDQLEREHLHVARQQLGPGCWGKLEEA